MPESTHSFICRDTKQILWVCQGYPANAHSTYIYGAHNNLKRLLDFLFATEGHPIEFVDDTECTDFDDYKEFGVDFDD
jgi:hypothetical protein